jgi:hypothetical protein
VPFFCRIITSIDLSIEEARDSVVNGLPGSLWFWYLRLFQRTQLWPWGAALLPCPKRKPQAEEKLHLFGRLIWMRWVKRKDQVGRILKSEEEEEIVPLSK